MTGLLVGVGVEPPPLPDAGELTKIWKRFLKKIAKIALFCYILQRVSKPRVKFSRGWTKNTSGCGYLRKF